MSWFVNALVKIKVETVTDLFSTLRGNKFVTVFSLFSVGRKQVVGLVDEAWSSKVWPGTLQANGNRVWIVDMGRQVGTSGQASIQIVVRDGTTQIITAFPK
ncbi:hypothetical protein [Pseudomonas asplenii]|uniref:hypothetical protein n=1 Tax=Pseudomonas asplenii TaxID=53407 RepID=UPI0012FE13A2|nr:hypothetical protein [Pseudomonas asplenii]